ncbi:MULTISPECIES: hypothetical protein [unclassified Paenibacillus]|uniref:hypothetical protein n=1 Tax=unclassified Paenibacillus TaxID=185978 RepID=UPI002377F82E|nr:hypothetical protein [Paenibacillus sp. MAHUQ-63]
MLETNAMQDWESWNDETLVSACFAPLIRLYKQLSSGDGDVAGLYRQMSSGQQALFMFQTYYLHAMKSAEELYWWSAYFMAQGERWAALKAKMRELGDSEFITLLQEVEDYLRTREHPYELSEFAAVSREDLRSDKELCRFIESAYKRLQQVSDGTIRRLADWIRSAPHVFLT